MRACIWLLTLAALAAALAGRPLSSWALDLCASRQAGSGAGTRWSFGLGWYGIGS